ncbi:hypothetical protein MP228_006192 [Amoeboaphelidium protococcarum]|nr:hypothetical protein MP228_006192 [Amoeboaphelidium protococcarum]
MVKKTENVALREEIIQLRKTNVQLQGEVSVKDRGNSQIAEEYKDFRDKMRDSRFAVSLSATASKLAKLVSQADALWKQIAENQVQLNKNQQQLDENKLKMDANKEELNAQQQELAYLKKNSAQFQNDYDFLSDKIGYNTAQIGQLKAELRERIQDQLHDLRLQTIKSAKSSKLAQQMISILNVIFVLVCICYAIDIRFAPTGSSAGQLVKVLAGWISTICLFMIAYYTALCNIYYHQADVENYNQQLQSFENLQQQGNDQ